MKTIQPNLKTAEDYILNDIEIFYDSWCGEPIKWGRYVGCHIPDNIFKELNQKYEIERLSDGYYVIDKKLSRQEAIEMYGEITEEIFGKLGGWKSVTFGNKKFISKTLKP